MQQIPRHQCLVYKGSPVTYLPALAALIGKKLKENNRCLYLNSSPMVAGMRAYLSAAGIDVNREITNGSLVLSSHQGYLNNRGFDIDRMLGILNDALDQALKDGYHGLWASGDMNWEFGPEKDFSKLLEYESRLEDLFRTHPAISGICQYHTDVLPREVVRQGLMSHPSIFINDTLSRLNPDYIPHGFISGYELT